MTGKDVNIRRRHCWSEILSPTSGDAWQQKRHAGRETESLSFHSVGTLRIIFQAVRDGGERLASKRHRLQQGFFNTFSRIMYEPVKCGETDMGKNQPSLLVAHLYTCRSVLRRVFFLVHQGRGRIYRDDIQEVYDLRHRLRALSYGDSGTA